MRRVAAVGLALAVVFCLTAAIDLKPMPTRAADYSNSNMIDDRVFDNVSTMSEQQIRDFINSRPNTCLSKVAYGYGGGNVFPNPVNYFTYDTNNLVDAAHVIYVAAQAWGINPQVILATLQKEQSLLTDNDCNDPQGFPSLHKAMGQGCAEGGPCPSAPYDGFAPQVMKGAWQLMFNRQRAEGNTSWDGDGSIVYGGFMTQGNRARCATCATSSYNGYATIDGQSTYLANGATAGLYTYTPHLNQSFPGIFEKYFGPTQGSGITSPQNIPWSFEQLDGISSSVSGQTADRGSSSASILFNSDIHLFYYDATNHTLRHALYDNSTGWSFATLDGAGGSSGRISADVGSRPSVAIYNSTLHIFYYDTTHHALRHGWSSDGTTWQFETIDGAGGANGRITADVGSSSTAVANSTLNSPLLEVFYYDATNGNLRHAWFDGNAWKFENLDGDSASVAHLSSNLGLDPTVTLYSGTVQLFYFDQQNGNLRHAWESPQYGWRFENLDGDPGSISHVNAFLGQNPTVTSYLGSLQLFYFDGQNGNLRHAWSNAGGWHFENLDGDPNWSIGKWDERTGITPYTTSLGNVLYVFYYDSDTQDLHEAWSDASGWQFSDLDGSGYSVSGTQVRAGVLPTAVPYSGSLQLFYYDEYDASLKHAWGTP